MKDDIETLRGFIVGVSYFQPMRGTAIAALDRVEKATAERDSLRAKLEKVEQEKDNLQKMFDTLFADWNRLRTRPIQIVGSGSSKLSADAPAQQTQLCPVHGKPFPCCVDFDPYAPAQPPQISDDVRSLLDEAIAALEPFGGLSLAGAGPVEDQWTTIQIADIRRARDVLTKLQAARNG
jgi:hypothetical protein